MSTPATHTGHSYTHVARVRGRAHTHIHTHVCISRRVGVAATRPQAAHMNTHETHMKFTHTHTWVSVSYVKPDQGPDPTA